MRVLIIRGIVIGHDGTMGTSWCMHRHHVDEDEDIVNKNRMVEVNSVRGGHVVKRS